jgi:hypothetical protein
MSGTPRLSRIQYYEKFDVRKKLWVVLRFRREDERLCSGYLWAQSQYLIGNLSGDNPKV